MEEGTSSTSASCAPPLVRPATSVRNPIILLQNAEVDLQGSVRATAGDDGEEIFKTAVSAVGVDDSQFVTLKLESGNYLQFQVDTGAQCLDLYKKATKDYILSCVIPGRQTITVYGGLALSPGPSPRGETWYTLLAHARNIPLYFP